jgi:predicted enzyme related to lactoylglutathione lyase
VPGQCTPAHGFGDGDGDGDVDGDVDGDSDEPSRWLRTPIGPSPQPAAIARPIQIANEVRIWLPLSQTTPAAYTFCADPRICKTAYPSNQEANMLRNAPIRPYLPVSDLQRARSFYEKVVGLTPKHEYAGGVIYECGGVEVFMYPTSNAGTNKASQAFWQVADVEAEVTELKSRGVVFEEYDMPGIEMKNSIVTAGGAKTAWFKDTEGNILALSQRL